MKTLVALFNPNNMSVVAVCPSDITPDPIHIMSHDLVVGRTAEIFTDQDELLGYLQGRKAQTKGDQRGVFQDGLRLARLLALVRGEFNSMGVVMPHVSGAFDELLEHVFVDFDIPTLRCAYCDQSFPSCTEKRDSSGATTCPECWEPRMAG